jgi:tRNA A-37 threonylcarbamoyl transferase component Bud32
VKRPDIEWRAGRDSVQRRVAAWLADPKRIPALALEENPRRALHRLEGESPEDPRCVVKRHRSTSGRHPLREAAKRALGRSPARREWLALSRLHAAGVPVPLPLAWGRLADGDEIVVSEWREGVGLTSALAGAAEPERTKILDALREAIGRLHAAGFRHGDLHPGNLLVEPDRITLLDLQRARPRRHERERLRDLAQLEFSLTRIGVPPTEHGRLRDLLGVGEALDPALRLFVRDYVRGRGRRVLKRGRNWSRVRVGHSLGLCEASIEPATLASWIQQSHALARGDPRREGRVEITMAKAHGRALVIKRVAAGSWGRALADRVRGSSAARAFAAGQRLALLGEIAARPLGFLEERRFGLPVQSELVLEAVGQADLDAYRPASDQAALCCARALGAWLAECHAWGLHHRDLKAGNIRLSELGESFRFWWVDLEDVSIGARLPEDARVAALAQLNASLADDAFSESARRAGFDAYRARLPFAQESAAVLEEIARRSLARAHRWRGEGCGVSQPRQ